jgi:hypothetical protein
MGFYGYGKGGYLLVGRVLRGGGAEIQFPLSRALGAQQS